MIAWRIEREKWAQEWREIEKRDAEKKRQWEIENAPRLARERFNKELGEFFHDNSDHLFDAIRHMFRTHAPKKKLWLHSSPR